MEDYFRQYILVMIYTGLCVLVPLGMLIISYVFNLVKIRPDKSFASKYDTYECGAKTIGGKWVQFNFRYYMFAMLFLVFDVEVIFIYPWAVKFNQLGLFALIEMFIFIGILVVAWIYAWKKKDLEWED